jgi:hypothetical protein
VAVENCIVGSLISYAVPQIYNQVKENEMCRECSTPEREEEYIKVLFRKPKG